ncbi:MAG: hypothetical protein ACRD4E_10865 [Bryobacteraceae bacterium]
MARKNEAKLAAEIHDALPFLFNVQRGRIVPNLGVPFPPSFDYAFVTLSVDDILVRFCRGRGELCVRIASSETPDEWHEVSLLLKLIEKKENFERTGVLDLRDASRLMESQMDRLKEAFVERPGNDLKQRLAAVYADDRVKTKELEWEINQRVRSVRRG